MPRAFEKMNARRERTEKTEGHVCAGSKKTAS